MDASSWSWPETAGAVGAVLGLLGGVRAGEGPSADGADPVLEHVGEPAALGDGGVALGVGEAEDGGVGGEFVGEVEEPGDLVGDATGEEAVSFHAFNFCWGVWVWVGGRNLFHDRSLRPGACR